MYDYGFRMYDPQLGRWNRKDPLMEWHFNYSPYAYCYNNPINLIDPFGLDTVYVAPKPIDPAYVYYNRPGWLKRTLNKIGRWFTSGDTQPAGLNLVTSGQAISPTNTKSKHPAEEVNIDLLLPAISRAGAGPFSPSPLDAAKGLKRATDVVKTNSGNNNQTSDKKIVEENTGTAEQKTNADNQPIDDNGLPVNIPVVPEAKVVKSWGIDSAGVVEYKDSLSNGKVRYRSGVGNKYKSSNKKNFERAWNNW